MPHSIQFFLVFLCHDIDKPRNQILFSHECSDCFTILIHNYFYNSLLAFCIFKLHRNAPLSLTICAICPSFDCYRSITLIGVLLILSYLAQDWLLRIIQMCGSCSCLKRAIIYIHVVIHSSERDVERHISIYSKFYEIDSASTLMTIRIYDTHYNPHNRRIRGRTLPHQFFVPFTLGLIYENIFNLQFWILPVLSSRLINRACNPSARSHCIASLSDRWISVFISSQIYHKIHIA